MIDRTDDGFAYLTEGSAGFENPPDEPRWGGSGPTDRNAPVISDAN